MAHYREARTPSTKGKKLDHIRLREGSDDTQIVEHHYAEDGLQYHKPREYVFGADEGQELQQHLGKYLKVQPAPSGEGGEDV